MAKEPLKQLPNLTLERCPHCSTALPNLRKCSDWKTQPHDNSLPREWVAYACMTCGGCVLTAAKEGTGGAIRELYPRLASVDAAIPSRASDYLSQAIASIGAPAGGVMLAASAIDAMLKEKGHVQGSLNQRIDAAAAEHLITAEMALWAHDVRLDANDQRHADSAAALPSVADAKRAIEFALALADFLYVLPARVRRGRERIEAGASGAV